jgi:hypothetical protein
MAVCGIDHVQLAMPAGGEPLARRFYGEVLGLAEIPSPRISPRVAARGSTAVRCNCTSASNPTFAPPRERIRLCSLRLWQKRSKS